MAVASLVLGIVAIVFALIPGINFVGIIAGVIGIILGFIAKKQEPSGIATGGIVTSIIGAALGLLLYIACVLACQSAQRAVEDPNFQQQIQNRMNQLQQQQNQ